jgi:hypothetical protein
MSRSLWESQSNQFPVITLRLIGESGVYSTISGDVASIVKTLEEVQVIDKTEATDTAAELEAQTTRCFTYHVNNGTFSGTPSDTILITGLDTDLSLERTNMLDFGTNLTSSYPGVVFYYSNWRFIHVHWIRCIVGVRFTDRCPSRHIR